MDTIIKRTYVFKNLVYRTIFTITTKSKGIVIYTNDDELANTLMKKMEDSVGLQLKLQSSKKIELPDDGSITIEQCETASINHMNKIIDIFKKEMNKY